MELNDKIMETIKSHLLYAMSQKIYGTITFTLKLQDGVPQTLVMELENKSRREHKLCQPTQNSTSKSSSNGKSRA